jgi:NitT/TauT family transport system permease protein
VTELMKQRAGVPTDEPGATMSDTETIAPASTGGDGLPPLRQARAPRRRARGTGSGKGRAWLYLGRLAIGIVILVSWELSSGRVWSEFSVSKPSKIAERIGELASSGELWTHTRVTMTETLLGLVIGLLGGVVLGLVVAGSGRVGQLILPYVMALYSLPRVALAPLFIVWFGIGLSAKVVMVVTMVLFVAFYNTYEGVRNIDRDLLEMSRSMRAPWHQRLRWVILPSITPWLLTSLRLAIGLALIGAVISELVAASKGLGYYIKLSSNLFDTTGVFAGLMVVTFIAVVLEQLVVLIEKRVLRYREATS